MADLQRLPLHDLHVEHGARMVPFAGWEMPVQFEGVMAEHLHTRAKAGLFDVSHMGQVLLKPRTDMATLAAEFEALMPVSVAALAEGRQRYGLLTNDQGGIRDDLMFANRGDHFYVVVNAGCKDADIAHLTAHLGDQVRPVTDRALLALQGPRAEDALAQLVPAVATMRFMDVLTADTLFGPLWISRSGYTGEDGFEISVPFGGAEGLARALLAMDEVAPIGLGARDSLRLEAGLCLYGHDIDEHTTPVEAGLTWAIQKSRRGGGFAGDARILRELSDGSERLRVGLLPEGRAPMREGVALFAADGTPVGTVTSGGFGPSVGAPVAMGYVAAAHAAVGTPLFGEVRGKRLPVTVAALPFIPASYKR
ncbi:glycine cleavage system aminomethyltransferase GcvT [Falsirhodobacter sp. 20TX0035]|uniref:glycine cleavage system aminomethyltransferase GcvT n=1 Tax=Falsirhodobacter sp. 20TX0035 TaxID=3022019 RepID=UPI002330B79C|nr:glycine cleavage system aminomethyltransferase GcvT [Falsirhodobacter sp. 20TX0035]MDB6453625.1 glycine cleavage system aminomethyltransferase GcvT [Falsirhodobacter sp. 20TX0035]